MTDAASVKPATVKRRTVFYIPGFDPRGPVHYYRLYTAEAAKQAAKERPVPSNAYPMAILFNGDGNIIAGPDGMPVVVPIPMNVANLTASKVEFSYPDQALSRQEAAKLAGVHVATVKRAEASGDLPLPNRPTERRVHYRLNDVLDWMAGRKAVR